MEDRYFESIFLIIEYLACVAEITSCYIFGGIFLKAKKRENIKYQIVIIPAILGLLLMLSNTIELVTIFNSLIGIMLCYVELVYFYRRKYGLIMVLPLIHGVLIGAVDLAVIFCTSIFGKFDLNSIVQGQSLRRILCIILSKFSLILLVTLLSKIFEKTYVMYKKYVVVIGFQSFLVIVMLYVALEINMYTKGLKNGYFNANAILHR